MIETPQLTVVMYHYVREFASTRFPSLKGLELASFVEQVDALRRRYEMATLESALALLNGDYVPQRDLCLLTFDDGLREHYDLVSPVLRARGLSGVFFVISSCAEEGRVAAVHKNHFLMASLPPADYRREFVDRLAAVSPSAMKEMGSDEDASRKQATAAYRWDDAETARFKYLLNFQLPPSVRDQVLDGMFAAHLGEEAEFARELYFNWDEARAMQRDGMTLGGHTHRHQALASLAGSDQQQDLAQSTRLLSERTEEQSHWPFSYPYGKPQSSFTAATSEYVREQGYCCAFSTIVGENAPGEDLFRLKRIDTKDVA